MAVRHRHISDVSTSCRRSFGRAAIMRFALLFTFVASSLLIQPLQASSPREYPEMERVMLEMSDGIRLATDIYYPQGEEGPWPVILYRTPYGIIDDNIGWVAEHGYVGVCQDCRGRFDSEGLDRMFLDDGWGPDHMDGRETAEWVLAQPWCNGHIATMGGSARGITQNLLAGSVPPGLDCQEVGMAPASLYHHAVFPGGVLRRRDIIGWLGGQGSSYMLDSLVAHPNYDEYWTYLDTQTRDPLITVPTYQQGGWYDLFADGQVAKFLGLQFNGGPGALGNQKLIMGAWCHGSGTGELEYPENNTMGAAQALIGYQGDWYDHWIHGVPNGIMDLPAMAYYLMGDVDDPHGPGNEWRTTDTWPPPGVVEESWYLHEGGVLDLTPPAPEEAPAGYSFDPYNPVPTIGGANLIGELGPYDQRPVEGRPDVVLYTSEVLENPVEVSGAVRLILYASSDRIDTDFTAKLTDVYPDGRSMLVCDGILRARHRLSMESEDFLTPNQVYEFEILIGNTAIVFNHGHRIRLAVSSSNYERFDVNPNTGEPFDLEYDTMLTAFNTLRQDAQYPS
ncbi:MAG: CocE/NonD family hydrolase, partial [Candidatus Eisenbacteria bacterium]|nr:CocE/NonD family hydrolase [Candidatus Eisenbacteria bacterium]